MDNNQPIPEEVKEWIRRELEKYSIPLAMAGFEQGAEAMYRHLSPSIESLQAERDKYRTALIYIEGGNSKMTKFKMQAIARASFDQYPLSPKDKDNG